MPRAVDLYSSNFTVNKDPTRRIGWNNTDLTIPQIDTLGVIEDAIRNFFTEVEKLFGIDITSLQTTLNGIVGDLRNVATSINQFLSELAVVAMHDAAVFVNNAAAFIQNAVNNLVAGLFNIVGGITNFVAADVLSASVSTQSAIAANSSALAALGALSTQATNGGTSAFLDFTLYSNSSSITGFTESYSGPGTSTLGITSGTAVWQVNNNSSRSVIAIYNVAATQTDYQLIGGMFDGPPGWDAFSSARSYNYIFGRVDSPSAPNNYIYVQFGVDSCQLGCVVSGVATAWVSRPGFVFSSGSSYWLECGTSGGARIYRVLNGTTPIITWTEVGTSSMLGSGYRNVGMGEYWPGPNIVGSTNPPGPLSAFAFSDNTPVSVTGSGFRQYRASTSTVSQSSGINLVPSSLFDTADDITSDLTYASGTNNKLTVSVAGWYMVTIRMAITGGTPALVVLYHNGSPVQYGPESASTAVSIGATFLVYCAANDYLQPGTSSSGTTIIGDATGAQTYWEVAFLNNKQP